MRSKERPVGVLVTVRFAMLRMVGPISNGKSMTQQSQPLKAALWMIGAMVSFSVMAVAGRELAGPEHSSNYVFPVIDWACYCAGGGGALAP